MDTFYTTSKKKLKLTRGNTCCQSFVTDKSLIYVVPMQKESEILIAMKLFVKEIGVPEAIITNTSTKTSQAICRFCILIETILKILKEGTL